MIPRRQFLATAIATSVYPMLARAITPTDDAVAVIERLRRTYSSQKSFSAISRSTADTIGMKVPGEVRIAFAAPGRLCVQLGLRGEVQNCEIVDGGKYLSWSRSKDWRDLGRFGMTLAGLHGARVMLGFTPYFLALLLFDDQNDVGEGLRSLTQASCQAEAGRCTRLQGVSEETQVVMELDAENGAIRRVHTDETRKSISISIQAEVESRFGPQIDMDALIEGLRKDPGKPLKV